MTETQKIDLKTAKAAVESIAQAYKEKSELVLDPDSIGENLLDRMPSPTGWRLLILPYRGKGKTESGIYLPDNIVEENSVSTQVRP